MYPDPVLINHGFKDPSNATFFCGDQVTYICDSGYEPRGELVAQCTVTGQFSKKPPECVIPGELCLQYFAFKDLRFQRKFELCF